MADLSAVVLEAISQATTLQDFQNVARQFSACGYLSIETPDVRLM